VLHQHCEERQRWHWFPESMALQSCNHRIIHTGAMRLTLHGGNEQRSMGGAGEGFSGFRLLAVGHLHAMIY